jgi:hypothetical protein
LADSDPTKARLAAAEKRGQYYAYEQSKLRATGEFNYVLKNNASSSGLYYGTPGIDTKYKVAANSANGSANKAPLVPNPMFAACTAGPCKPNDWEAPVDWLDAGKATVGIIGNAGGVVAGAVMWGAPTGVTQALGAYLIADGAYGVAANGLDFAAAVGWRKEKVNENINSIPRLTATVLVPGNESAQRAADAVSLTSGFIGGRMVVQPLMFSARKINATSHMSPAAQSGLSGFSLLQVYDASVPAVETIQKTYQPQKK